MGNFTAAEAKSLFKAILSYAQELSIFQSAVTHEPVSPPGTRLYCSIVLGPVRPVPSSGLAAVSGMVTLMVRVWSSALQRPLDDVDPEVLAATCALMSSFAGGFTLGGTVREIDLFAMSAEPGWVDMEGKPTRVMEITLPVIINDMFEESP